jgi:hypothetical protein
MAIQNALSRRIYGDLTREDKTFMQEILTECDTIAKQKEEKAEQL